ncbi:trypsin-like peptidase domain-containing protein [Streptomyces fractus]|uniref:VMAP-C domain-containing protein n=1 Tax=Streptomyces fractus TaxID=641806 RepID=UPI003CEE674E
MTPGRDGGAQGKRDGALHALRELVMAATVRIHRTGPGYAADEPESFVGSGFFIAPNWVLTCAHVARGGEGGELTVAYESGTGRGTSHVPGEVVATLPEGVDQAVPGKWPVPDLALVRLREPVDHECVYVAERPAVYYSEGEVFYAGWTVVDGQMSRLDGPIAVKGTLGGSSSGVLRLGENDLPYGISGGPVVDPVRGEVIGVLKSRADHGRGGTSIGTEQLRTLPGPVPGQAVWAEHEDLYQAVFHAHDRYHRDRQRQSRPARNTWADVQNRLGARPGRTLTPGERAQLLGRLADLPPPVSTRGLLDILESLPEFEGDIPLPSPRGWRDGLGALYEGARDEGVPGLVLDYAMQALLAERPFVTPGTTGAEESLWEWVRQAAEGWLDGTRRRRIEKQWAERPKRITAPCTGPKPPRDPATRHTALLELVERSWERGRWDWQVYVTRPGGARDCVQQDVCTPTDALPERLAAPLAEAFRQCDEPGWPAILQVVLPHARLDLPVDAWRTRPDEPPLGARGPVVLRCGDRDRLPGEHGFAECDPAPPEWDEDRADRWRWLHAHNATAEFLDCDQGVPRPVPEGFALRNLPSGSVPVMCRYGEHHYEDDTVALARILLGGFGVALWRRGPVRSAAVCGEFHRGAAVTVADARGARHLPERVHELRRKLLESHTEAYWADGIALIYDDPNLDLPGAGELLEAP